MSKWEDHIDAFAEFAGNLGGCDSPALAAVAVKTFFTRDQLFQLAEEFVVNEAEDDQPWPSSYLAFRQHDCGLMGVVLHALVEAAIPVDWSWEGEGSSSDAEWAVVPDLMSHFGFSAATVPPVLLVREYMLLQLRVREVRELLMSVVGQPMVDSGCGYRGLPVRTWSEIDVLADGCKTTLDVASLESSVIRDVLRR